MAIPRKHVQAVLTAHEYEALQRTAERENLTIKDAVREAALAWVRAKGVARDPLLGIVGVARGGRRASVAHDADYLENPPAGALRAYPRAG